MKSIISSAIIAITLSACSSSSGAEIPSKPIKPIEPIADGDVLTITTTSNRFKNLEQTYIPYIAEGQTAEAKLINIDSKTSYQTIDGFGAAITGSTCYNLAKMTDADRQQFLFDTFDTEEGYGFSYIRISIGCSDFSLSEYTCCDTEGIENFALTEEENAYIIPILKEIIKINPTIKIIGSPWTAPRWMKVNDLTSLRPTDKWTGGQLNPAYYADYATYFVKWLQAFAAEGINVSAITIQNEPLNRGNSASMYMGWEEERDFVKILGPALRANSLDKVKIYAFDHNYNYDGIASQNGYPLKIYADKEASAFVAGAAYHNYGGSRSELLNVAQQAPDKELLFTETSIGTWNNGVSLESRLMDDMEEVALGTVLNGCRGAIVWNLMLDSEKGPNRNGGCQTCYGAVDIDKSNYKTIKMNSHYYIIAHMSAVVKTGAKRVTTSGFEAEGLMYAAFVNPDGSQAIVLLNKSNVTHKVSIKSGDKTFTTYISSKSVVSALFNKSK